MDKTELIKASFELERSIKLRGDSDFYLAKRRFPFRVADEACDIAVTVGDESVKLQISPALVDRVQAAPDAIEASLAEVTEAAMRFYQGEKTADWPASELQDKLHLLRYDVGLAFGVTANNSVAHIKEGVLHGEAKKPVVELLAYGLSLLAAEAVLDISPDRFVFLQGKDSRPDFAADVDAADLLLDTNMATCIAGDAISVGIESKGLSQHGGFIVTRGENEGSANKTLVSLVKKYSGFRKTGAFFGFLVTTEKRREEDAGETRIALADPGETDALDREEMAILLLRSLVAKLRRMGAWGTLHRAANWLTNMGAPLSSKERSFLRSVPATDAFLTSESVMERDYKGRFFSDVVMRLGTNIRRPLIPRSEIEVRLRENDAGSIWYHGVRTDVIELVQNQDIDALLELGVGRTSAPAVVRFLVDERGVAASVMGSLQQALRYAQ